MDDGIFAFESEEDFDRTARATRWAESQIASGKADHIRFAGTQTPVYIQVVSANKDSDGYVAGKFVTRNVLDYAPAGHWDDLVIEDTSCLVEEINEGGLTLDHYYWGWTVGIHKDSKIPIVVVQSTPASTPASTTAPPTTTPAPCTGTCRWKWYASVSLWKKVSSTCSPGCLCTAPTVCSGIEDGCTMDLPCITSSKFYKSGSCVDWDHNDTPTCWTCGGSPPGDTATDGVKGPVRAKCYNTSTPQWPCDQLPVLSGVGFSEYGTGMCVCVSPDGTRTVIANAANDDCAILCADVPQWSPGGAVLSFDCKCHDNESGCLNTCCTDPTCQGNCVYDQTTGEILERNCTGCVNCDCAPPPTTLTTPPPGECFILSAGCVPGTTSTTTAPPPWYCAADPTNPANCPIGGCNCAGYFSYGQPVKGCFQTPSIPAGWVKCSGPYGEQALCNSNCIGTTTTCPPKWFCIPNDQDSTCRDGSHCTQLPVVAPACTQADVNDPVFGVCSGPYDVQGDCEAQCANVTTTPNPNYYCYSCQNYDGWNNPVGLPYSSCTNSAPGNGSGGGIHPICTQEGGPYADGTCDSSCFGTTTQTTPPPTTPPPTTPPPNTTIAPPTGAWICHCDGTCGFCCGNCACADYGCGSFNDEATCQANCGASSTTSNPFSTAPFSTATPG